ncbi:MAG: bacillithiol biosynthesis BshC [Candidatus Bathyarchaeota archaeon]|nr:MAG: bacillithiol biosynthesis BshC [Candidatus Bathyarchaeota archaeon]
MVDLAREKDLPPAHRLYTSHVEAGSEGSVAEELWGRIPATLGEAYMLLAGVRKSYGPGSENLEELKKIVKDNLRRLGILTSRVSENIDRLDRGAIEAGQQPNALGGPSLVLNKIAFIKSLSNLGRERYTPLFYVADYDSVQAELINARVPSPSPRGLLLSYPVPPELEGSPIHELPNPPEAWLRKTIEKLKSNYRGLLREAEPGLRERSLLNLDHALTVLRATYHSTENVSDWSTKTLGTLVNLEADLGVPIMTFSATGTSQLFQGSFELLLAEPNRTKFLNASNRAVDIVEGAGYRPGIGPRDEEYVPFYFECPTLWCHRTRIELKYRRDPGSSTARIAGKCPKCGETHEFSINPGSPDLTEIIDMISPRVDSRQIIVDSVIPVLAHAGGPGETSYYPEIIPAARALGLPFPVYLRYNRLFYNTLWNETYAQSLKGKGYPTLTDDDLFKALSGWVVARNQGDAHGLKAAHIQLRRMIEETNEKLVERLDGLRLEVEAIKQSLRDPEKRDSLIQEMGGKQALAQEIETYLSSALGRFSPEKFGQEVSWAWLDVAVVAGLGDLMGVFLRQYNRNTPNSSVFFTNL